MYRFPRKIYLASQSPRRRALLKQFGIPHAIIEGDHNEPETHCGSPEKTVEHFALVKARTASGKVRRGIVLGFDTIVFHNGRILEKPRSRRDAYAMLRALSGSAHTVYTGMAAVVLPEGRCEVFHEKTRVFFRKLEETEIKNYINTGEPFDKAGAYGIQGAGGSFVKRVNGCFFTVVGLPAALLMTFLNRVRQEKKRNGHTQFIPRSQRAPYRRRSS
ncbi:MAG: septum formation protein Maf [Candidatus Raymondbacteria bacterium RifOxyA12_full_50_37]|uniref:dTTP/UTP pyrophosphatase n=1 Tax=Candidatus Raymondbacteria bacterium RIFOXYD12_FULL_49_13 TaxID=1817890 RepID=A0A1F7F842_UNCRA|nr:MAG: septum formation protein Maf [Candidatus Raymondbacteria bacterium RifOxyA12_full_50_37]OGJ86747.1 MAG: septum formation protein Maf [Candidatus Raymondbacteria bacterium RIFOXYA2_FULL_49_16]OGK01552.1 MAG: septum formation protein Maf [Candidatus Raymondbacteria bacterium RifOxyB12_full_50_8]OGK02840.1 MAG: septum formation protein Maf [Candidatus Raymondbacteria bacterium RIFOXYD12_FULL_49_13]OGP40924.1 MAG: septum formation protein Maf [Candidatus Raymondbacteria bacterium RIFOXYB2_F